MTIKMTVATLGAGLMLAGCASAPWSASRAAIETQPPACADFQVSIYFERDEVKVTREARSVLNSARTMARGCKVEKARVVGLADAVGAADVNMDLSRARAVSVTKALTRAGFGQVEFDVAAAGDIGATTTAGASAPLRRRADIFFDVSKP
ncbi:MAG: flagellar motor protein MotB [Caulobacter sp. 12-67-6]|nr:MAG: flagellar motor protein MotB [Caulobacter sp. 12-67-6]OYX70072.1 MAG: flagellar motor protein MotB [Caulobacter sp. 32-67-35]OYX92618.1 MAG: flagellar motor protein MotB [Caulobacter sp. 35-67-4]OZA74991.1 MAG: flagellar motor protein MotB [Caulobacter sp. 39-67-4]HQR88126.1 OmpA family protein [Caulobacter sp.]